MVHWSQNAVVFRDLVQIGQDDDVPVSARMTAAPFPGPRKDILENPILLPRSYVH